MSKGGIVKTKVVIDFNEDELIASVNSDVLTAQKVLDTQVLNDSNFFVPVVTGTLKKSGITNTVVGSGKVIWHTPYAKRQYYGDAFNHNAQNNPSACSRWFEAAKVRNMSNWERLVNEHIKRT